MQTLTHAYNLHPLKFEVETLIPQKKALHGDYTLSLCSASS